MKNQDMTLRELCLALGLSRRTVQGYERHGLVHATGRNFRGYLLYDAAAQAQIRRIRQYQRFGFPVKDIGELLGLSGDALRLRLEAQREKLRQTQRDMQADLAALDALLERLN